MRLCLRDFLEKNDKKAAEKSWFHMVSHWRYSLQSAADSDFGIMFEQWREILIQEASRMSMLRFLKKDNSFLA